jgi:NAD(P)H-dependent FMN reductase
VRPLKRWNDKIKEADAFIIVTPEYNQSIPGVLKNAIDSVFFSFRFRQKPVAFVAYSLGFTAGARAVEHLTQIMVKTEALPVRTPTLILFVKSLRPEGSSASFETVSLESFTSRGAQSLWSASRQGGRLIAGGYQLIGKQYWTVLYLWTYKVGAWKLLISQRRAFETKGTASGFGVN